MIIMKKIYGTSIKKYLQLPDGDWSIPIKKIAQDVQNEYLNSKQSKSF